MVDAITTQVVRNRVSSLMQEMHYHFYRSGYSTIIRESRDFSCVILDCRGGLIVAPPMFFHAPVYRHLVGKILQRYGAENIHAGDMFVCNHPYEGGLPHVSDMAFVAPILSGSNSRRLRRIDRAQGRCRRHHAGLHFGQRHGNLPGGAAAAAGENFFARRFQCRSGAPHPRQQPAARTGRRRHARANGGDADGRRAHAENLRTVRRRRGHGGVRGAAQGRRRRVARRDRNAARWRGVGRRIYGQRRRRARPAGALCRHCARRKGRDHLRSEQQRPAGARTGQSASVDGRGLRVLLPDRRARSEA